MAAGKSSKNDAEKKRNSSECTLEKMREAYEKVAREEIGRLGIVQMVLSELIEFGACISAETVKACALIGLHTTAEENALRSDSGSSPDL